MSQLTVSRRSFLRTSAIAGGGLMIGFSLSGCSQTPVAVAADPNGFVPNAFLQFTPEGRVRFYCPRDEMGQGVTTGLATLIAEDLDLHPSRFELLFAGVHADYNNPGMGIQLTGGSNSIRAHYEPLRQVGANTRQLFLRAAAQDLGVSINTLATDDGHVVQGSARYPYEQFLATAARLEPGADAPLKAPSEFRYIGRAFPRLDGVAKATGTAVYGIDVELPDMHYAVVRRAPVAGAELASFDATSVSGMPGVTDVVPITDGVAIVAQRYWQARKAAQALTVSWTEVPLSRVDTETVRSDFARALDGDAGFEALNGPEHGNVDEGLAGSDITLTADYWAPFLAHAPLEPMNAVVRVTADSAEVWSGTQSVSAARGLVARAAGLEPEQVISHNTYLGGAFGRRGTLTHITEATEISRATGKTIKLLWSREDDLQHGVYRPASLMRISAGLTGDRINAWSAHRAGGNITPETLRNTLPGLMTGLSDGVVRWVGNLADKATRDWFVDGSSIEGLFEDYDATHLAVRHTTVDHGLPLTFWRSVGHSYTSFAKESMVDELALAANLDPVALRIANTQNNPRLQNVIRVAGEQMQAMQVPAGHHLGFAAHHSFATDVAQIAEVSVTDGKIRVHRVVCVVDCGVAVNPDIVRAQMEGGIIFGLTAALYGKVDLRQGAIVESNFHDYPLLRANEAPDIEVVIVDSSAAPTGVGEPGLPPIAPAVANAVFRATGQRLRELPLRLV
ncbi:MAG: molybdopterin cofactor-binding domain-containing protein [Pseudomonadales bacterium]